MKRDDVWLVLLAALLLILVLAAAWADRVYGEIYPLAGSSTGMPLCQFPGTC